MDTETVLPVEQELRDLSAELAPRDPDTARRLAAAADRLRAESDAEPVGYITSGEAASLLGVSPNTVKKWVRLGIIRDFWTLPGSGYLKIARSEIDRIRAEGAPNTVEVPNT